MFICGGGCFEVSLVCFVILSRMLYSAPAHSALVVHSSFWYRITPPPFLTKFSSVRLHFSYISSSESFGYDHSVSLGGSISDHKCTCLSGGQCGKGLRIAIWSKKQLFLEQLLKLNCLLELGNSWSSVYQQFFDETFQEPTRGSSCQLLINSASTRSL